MAEQVFPSDSQHRPDGSKNSIEVFDMSFIRVPTGWLKILEFVCSLLGLICISTSHLIGSSDHIMVGRWYLTVAILGIIISLSLFMMHALRDSQVLKKFSRNTLRASEIFALGAMTIFYAEASHWLIGVSSSNYAAVIFSLLFGFFATFAFAFDLFLNCNAMKNDCQQEDGVKGTSINTIRTGF